MALAVFVLSSHAAAGGAVEVRTPPPGGLTTVIAALPPENLTGEAVPVRAIEDELRLAMSFRGVRLLDQPRQELFMYRNRVRYTGGISDGLAAALLGGTEARAALITSIESFGEGPPPRIAILARLVSLTDEPRILWMDGVGLSGADSPGFLGLGRVGDLNVLLRRAAADLADSLVRFLEEGRLPGDVDPARRFRPRRVFRTPLRVTRTDRPVRVAVLPFIDRSGRRHAGTLIGLQFVRFLFAREELQIVEPGVVRQALLQSRLIPAEGVSLPQADVLRVVLDVDAVLTGEVLTYTEAAGRRRVPAVDFYVQAIDTSRRQVLWSSISYNFGDDGVYFFDVGRVHTAHELAARMSLGVVRRILQDRETAAPGDTGVGPGGTTQRSALRRESVR